MVLDENHIIQKAFLIYPAVDSTDYRKQTRYHWSYDAYPIIEEQKEFAHSRIERIKGASRVSEKDSLYIQGKTTYDDPLVSVIYTEKAKLKAFPPVIMVSSEYDFLRVSNEYFAKMLDSLGVSVKAVRYCGCDHGFLDLLGTIPQAEELCLFMADEIKSM